jgi:hypothetical protein
LSGSQVKNKAIKEICGAGSEQMKNKIDWLGTSNPFIPRVLNTVFKITPSGAREQFLGTFGSFKTLRTLLSTFILSTYRKVSFTEGNISSTLCN